MSNSPVEIFYGDREFVLLPPGINVDLVAGKSYQEIIQLARQKRIKYILVNKNTREFNPDFEVSIEERDLRELYRYRGKDGDMTVVYEVIN